PAIVITAAPAKIANMWRPVFDGSKLATVIIFGGSYVTVMLFAAIGVLAVTRRGVGASEWYLIAFALALAIFHAFTIAEIRFRMPIESVIIVLAGAGLA